ncbi:MAG: transglycosylase SLT domain-containing protein [Luteibacter sp.]
MIGALLLVFLGALWLQVASRPPLVGFAVRRLPRWPGVLMLVAGFSIASIAPVHAATPPSIPEASAMYRRWVEQAVAEEWGVEGSSARLAAQIHQESSWNPKARSPVGAEGLAQFMPSTAKWITTEFPKTLGTFDPWDPQQAALAAAVYDAWLVRRNPGRTECDTWSFALSAYNGGERQLHKEQALALSRGKAADVWQGHVADARTRSLGAWRENRAYVARILLLLEPAYLDAGWSGRKGCPR